jgi:ABC-type Fe3+/spermidine/putrescine transport system ATPase subunit
METITKPFIKVTLNWQKFDGNMKDIQNIPCIYQIYGDSPIYGQNVLLYIGKANCFEGRMLKHEGNLDSFITRQPNRSFRYAEFEKHEKHTEAYQEQLSLICSIEEILIVMHKPSFNSNHIINISAKAKEKFYYIQNEGERGMLQLEVTNYYFATHQLPDKDKKATPVDCGFVIIPSE